MQDFVKQDIEHILVQWTGSFEIALSKYEHDDLVSKLLNYINKMTDGY